MSTAVLRLLCALLLVGMAPGLAAAQEEGEDDEPQLPEIAPREIEILGELQLGFPTLERQPLVGFASPPSIPSVPEDRSPYVEPYKQSLEDLPESLPSQETVSPSVTSPPTPKQGLLEIGGGRYASRFLRSHFSFPLTTRQTLSVQADYDGTEGFTPFPNADLTTPDDNVEGRVQFESRHDAVSFQAGLHGTGTRYTLYGLPSVGTSSSAPERTGIAGGGRLQLRTHGSVTSSVRLQYDHTQYDTQLDPTDAASTALFREGRLEGHGAATFPIGTTEARIDVSGSRSTLGGDVPANTAYSVDGGAALQIIDSDRLSVRAGGRVLGFESPADPSLSSSPSATASFVLPQGRAELSLSSAVSIYAQNTPHLTGGSLSHLYAQAPYAAHAPSIRPTLSTTDAETGLLLSYGSVRFRTTGGLQYAPSYPFVESPTGSGTSSQSQQIGYGSAQILHGGAELALQGIDGLEASAGLSVRDGTLVGDDTVIPYFSPLVANAMVSLSFSDGRGRLETTGTVESPRPVDRLETDDVRTYVAFDVEGSFEVTSLLHAVVRFENLAPRAPKRWSRYPRPPATVMGGFRIHW